MNRKQIILIISVVVALAIVGIVGALIAGHTQHSQDKTVAMPATVAQIDSPYKDELAKGTVEDMGQVVAFSTISMKINSAMASSTATNGYNTITAEAGTKFLTVNMTITNTTDSPITSFTDDNPMPLTTPDYKVINNDTRDVKAFAEDTLLGTSFDPDVPKTGSLLYIVPDTLHSGVIGSLTSSTHHYVGERVSF